MNWAWRTLFSCGLLLAMARPGAAQTIASYNVGLCPGTTGCQAPIAATIVPIPASTVTCGLPQPVPPTAPLLLNATTGAWLPGWDDPTNPALSCQSTLALRPAFEAAAGGLTAGFYVIVVQAVDDTNQSSAWSLAGIPSFRKPGPPPAAPTGVKVRP